MPSWDPCCGVKIVLSAFSLRPENDSRAWELLSGPGPAPTPWLDETGGVWMLLKPLQMGKQLFFSQVWVSSAALPPLLTHVGNLGTF